MEMPKTQWAETIDGANIAYNDTLDLARLSSIYGSYAGAAQGAAMTKVLHEPTSPTVVRSSV